MTIKNFIEVQGRSLHDFSTELFRYLVNVKEIKMVGSTDTGKAVIFIGQNNLRIKTTDTAGEAKIYSEFIITINNFDEVVTLIEQAQE